MRCAILIHSLVTVLYFETSLEDGPVNYCGAKMCAYTDGHTFCRYPPGPSPLCVGYSDARLSQDDKSRVLRRLNRRRSEAARGGRGLPAAADMLKLRWVEELAREAQRWADQCQPPSAVELHDDCRDLYSITVGQCVSSVVGEAPGLRFETMVDMWPMQGRLYKRFLANRTEIADKSTGYYGDYAQMFWSRTYMVGCGRSRFMVLWHGRKRSVDRLVCNFAPRWPGPHRELWSPGAPASACPARSRPDVETPELCSYHYTMDELYDEDNTMSLEEHLLLDTVLEIERNASLDYIGSMDELYLTKLAIATMQNPILTSTNSVISVQKRSILKEIEVQSDTDFVNRTYIQVNAITERNTKYKILKRKSYLLGRPKTYDIDDLNESNIKKENDGRETLTVARDPSYEDYNVVIADEGTSTVTTYQPTNRLKESLKHSTDNIPREGEEMYVTEFFTETIPFTIPCPSMQQGSTGFKQLLNGTNTDLEILQLLNNSALDPTIVDDYLSNPETAQQLQEALDRMERNLAESAPHSTSGKVRRELRDLKNEALHNLKNESISEKDSNETDRGPMINMVLKYMPYLKPLEKSIIGDTKDNVNSARVVSPSFILFIVLYF